jgi:hypothetical protein
MNRRKVMKNINWILVILMTCTIAAPTVARADCSLPQKATFGDTSPATPSLASFNGLLYIAWNGTDSAHRLNVMSSTDNGLTFGNKYTSGETSPVAPALAVHNGNLYITWRGTNNQKLNVAVVNTQGSSITGFSQKVTLGDTSPSTPSLASLNGRLYIAWNGTDSAHRLNVMSSTDNGLTFGNKYTYGDTSPVAPALAVHNDTLYITWRGTNNQKLNVANVNEMPMTQVSLNVPLRGQETSNWCWAASGQMIMDYLGYHVAQSYDVAQCTQANNEFGLTYCCTIALCPTPAAPQYDAFGNCIGCACPGWPEFDKYGFDFQVTNWWTPLSWDQLSNQINCLNKPVAFSWAWVGGGGHMMVARGLRILPDGTQWVQINDPWAPCNGDIRFITYSVYDQLTNNYRHLRDYYDITRR